MSNIQKLTLSSLRTILMILAELARISSSLTLSRNCSTWLTLLPAFMNWATPTGLLMQEVKQRSVYFK